MSTYEGLPVSGYRPQTDLNIQKANELKVVEERVLRIVDDMLEDPALDKRWVNIGRTHMQEGFMALVRSIFQPQRIKLPEEASLDKDGAA